MQQGCLNKKSTRLLFSFKIIYAYARIIYVPYYLHINIYILTGTSNLDTLTLPFSKMFFFKHDC